MIKISFRDSYSAIPKVLLDKFKKEQKSKNKWIKCQDPSYPNKWSDEMFNLHILEHGNLSTKDGYADLDPSGRLVIYSDGHFWAGPNRIYYNPKLDFSIYVSPGAESFLEKAMKKIEELNPPLKEKKIIDLTKAD